MATDSIRKQALAGTATLLAGINGGTTYFQDLTGSGQVSTVLRSKSLYLEMPYNAWIWVHDGTEQMVSTSVTDHDYTAHFEILLDLLVRDETSAAMQEELNDLLHDVHLAIGADSTLSGTVADAWVSSIDEPAYSLDDNTGVVRMRLTAVYDYTAGVTI